MSEMQDRGRLVVLEQGNVPAHVKCRNYVLVDRDRGWIQLYELDRQQVIEQFTRCQCGCQLRHGVDEFRLIGSPPGRTAIAA